jgi:hypothetical protein
MPQRTVVIPVKNIKFCYGCCEEICIWDLDGNNRRVFWDSDFNAYLENIA